MCKLQWRALLHASPYFFFIQLWLRFRICLAEPIQQLCCKFVGMPLRICCTHSVSVTFNIHKLKRSAIQLGRTLAIHFAIWVRLLVCFANSVDQRYCLPISLLVFFRLGLSNSAVFF